MICRTSTVLVTGMLAAFACGLSAAPDAAGGEMAADSSRAGDGDITVSFDSEAQKRVGLQIKPLAAVSMQREMRVFGRVLDPSRLHAQASEIDTAEVSAQLSQQELGRLRQLQDNTSERRMQTAEAKARRDQLALQSARSNLRLTWGNAVTERDDLPELVRSLASHTHALVRLDLPAGDTLAVLPAGARIIPMGADTPVAGVVLGMAPNVDAQNLAQGILVLAPHFAGLLPGAAVTGLLEIPGPPLSGVVVPRSAVVRYGGRNWVYLQIGAGTFTRREVALVNPVENGWLVSRGVAPDERLVESGAQLLLSEERKAEINMED